MGDAELGLGDPGLDELVERWARAMGVADAHGALARDAMRDGWVVLAEEHWFRAGAMLEEAKSVGAEICGASRVAGLGTLRVGAGAPGEGDSRRSGY